MYWTNTIASTHPSSRRLRERPARVDALAMRRALSRVAARAGVAATPRARTSREGRFASNAIGADDDDGVTLTDACAERVRGLAREDGGDARLRLAVRGGGCSGFTYEFTFERGARGGADDKTFRAANGAEVVVDGVSYEYVKGSTIDYVEEMIKSSFEVVKNPRAKGSCGCGASFDAEDA